MGLTLYLFDSRMRMRETILKGISECIHDEGAHTLTAEIPASHKACVGEFVGLRCVDGRFRAFEITNAADEELGIYTICDSRGHYAGKGCWNSGDTMTFKIKGTKACITNSDVRETTSDYTIYSDGKKIELYPKKAFFIPIIKGNLDSSGLFVEYYFHISNVLIHNTSALFFIGDEKESFLIYYIEKNTDGTFSGRLICKNGNLASVGLSDNTFIAYFSKSLSNVKGCVIK